MAQEEQASMGATLNGTACHFRTWAPNASRISVVGSFNDWQADAHDMMPHPDGVWSVTIEGVRAGDEYLYRIDNRGGDANNPGQQGLFRVDPWARATRHASGNAVIVDVAAELVTSGLSDDPFNTPSAPDWLIYQAHVGSFTGNGDGVDTGPTGTGTFEQFEQKLSYIRSMGFNAVALLPIHENPGDGSAGYAPAHLFAPETSYGSPLALRHLIRAAHDEGLAVIFDVVWNHMADVDNRLWEFDGMTRDGGIFFEDAKRSPWGPRLAFWKREIRELIVANARMCLEEYHVDGLRIDAADEIATEVLTEVVASVRAEPMWLDKLLIVEWGGNDDDIQPALAAPLHFDRVWALSDPRRFADAVGLEAGRDAAGRVASLLELIELPGASRRIRYLIGSHDNAHDNLGGDRRGFRHFIELAGGRDDAIARAKARIGWALSVALPGTPMCFMGAECNQPGYWNPRPDQNSQQGDHRFDWRQCGDEHGSSMRALVTDANQLWWDFPALRQPHLELIHVDENNGVVAFLRPASAGPSILVVVNISESAWPDQGYHLPGLGDQTTWHVVLDSQADYYGGDSLTNPERIAVNEGTLSLSISRWSVLFLASVLPQD